MKNLWNRRLHIIYHMLDHRLWVPQRADGSVLPFQVGDVDWIGVSTSGTPLAAWRDEEQHEAWQQMPLEELLARTSGSSVLYVDDSGPLIPTSDLRETNLNLLKALRAVAAGTVTLQQFRDASRDSFVFVPTSMGRNGHEEDAEILTFTSALTLKARLGDTSYTRVPGTEIFHNRSTSGLCLDAGQPNALHLEGR
jgi:hypothetical protein